MVDNGRGIPTDINHEFKMSGVEIALTKLGGGGKFGGDGYKVSGGLHGVGVSVVNALSSEGRSSRSTATASATAWSSPTAAPKQTKLQVVGDAPRGRTGTTVTFWPDPTVFEDIEFSARTILERFQMMAFLNKGLEIRFKDERAGPRPEPVIYRYAGGIVDFVKHVNETKEPLFSKVGYFEQTEDDQEVEVAFQWNTGYQTDGLHSFANGITTIEGGTHEEGFRAALTTAVNKYARAKSLLKEKDPNLAGEDIREGLTAIISVRLREPQFEGQTKGKLGNPPIKTLVQKATNEKLGDWLEEHPTEANKIVKKAHRRASRPGPRPGRPATPSAASRARRRRHARQAEGLLEPQPRRARAVHRRGRLGRRLGHPGPRPPHPGDPADPGQDPQRRAGPHRPDAEEHRDPGAHLGHRRRRRREEFDVEKRRYDKVIMLCDADVDGSHIRTLLLTFFFRQMKPLVEHGHVYIAQPPLYSTEVGQGEGLPEGRPRQGRVPGRATRTTRRSSSASRASARWTARSSGTPRWTPAGARCCRSPSSRPPWPTRWCPR